MVFECWIVLRRSRWILMAMYVGDENLNATKKSDYISLVHSCRVSKEPPDVCPRVTCKLIL